MNIYTPTSIAASLFVGGGGCRTGGLRGLMLKVRVRFLAETVLSLNLPKGYR